MKKSKRYQEIIKKIDRAKKYSPDAAVKLLKETISAKFDETVEVHFKLGIDPKQSEQMIRGTLVLPAGAPKKKKIAAFVEPHLEKKAKEAGADIVGGEELVEKIKKGDKINFDIAIAVPAMMKHLSKIARILGPKGLMPNPKNETVTNDVVKTIKSLQEGKIDYKMDEQGNLHIAIAKISWDEGRILDNLNAVLSAIKKTRPKTAKGEFLSSITLCTTMGPGIKLAYR